MRSWSYMRPPPGGAKQCAYTQLGLFVINKKDEIYYLIGSSMKNWIQANSHFQRYELWNGRRFLGQSCSGAGISKENLFAQNLDLKTN